MRGMREKAVVIDKCFSMWLPWSNTTLIQPYDITIFCATCYELIFSLEYNEMCENLCLGETT